MGKPLKVIGTVLLVLVFIPFVFMAVHDTVSYLTETETPEQKTAREMKAWDAYTQTPEGKIAEEARKKKEAESLKLKAKEEAGQFTRYMFTRKCEEAFLDLGYDMKCLPVEDSKTLLIVGKPVNRVFVHQIAPMFHARDLKRMGFVTLKFWNGEVFSNYQEEFDVSQ